MEKERYIYTKIDGYYWIKDIETNENYCVDKKIVKLLNQQDARIKDLENIRDKGNQKLEDFYNEKIDKLDSDYNKHLDELIEENQQLKQQLSDEEKSHDLCIDIFNEECEKFRKQIKFESEARERFILSYNQKK